MRASRHWIIALQLLFETKKKNQFFVVVVKQHNIKFLTGFGTVSTEPEWFEGPESDVDRGEPSGWLSIDI